MGLVLWQSSDKGVAVYSTPPRAEVCSLDTDSSGLCYAYHRQSAGTAVCASTLKRYICVIDTVMCGYAVLGKWRNI